MTDTEKANMITEFMSHPGFKDNEVDQCLIDMILDGTAVFMNGKFFYVNPEE